MGKKANESLMTADFASTKKERSSKHKSGRKMSVGDLRIGPSEMEAVNTHRRGSSVTAVEFERMQLKLVEKQKVGGHHRRKPVRSTSWYKQASKFNRDAIKGVRMELKTYPKNREDQQILYNALKKVR